MAQQSGVYRGMSAEQRVAERRLRLLDAALTVWADVNLPTTMTAVCATAGLTERYFYESFRDLDDALAVLLDVVALEIETVTLAAAETAGEAPMDKSVAVLKAFVDLLAADPRKGRVAIIESMARPALRAKRTELLRHFAHRTAQEIQARSGSRRSKENEMAALVFIGGMAELLAAWLDGTLDATPDELVELTSPALALLHKI